MLKTVSAGLVRVVEKYMPDPYIFAAILTFVVYALSLVFTDRGPVELVTDWSNGLWKLLVFTMQISITLVFSTAIIRTEPVEKLLKSLCGLANGPTKAYFLTTLVAGIFSLFSWAAGLVVGAFMAKEMARSVKGCHYPLLVASGYSGFLIWHMGYSSSIGLVIATPGHFLEQSIGVIPTSETIFAGFNIITALVLLLTIPIMMSQLAPANKADIKTVDPKIFDNEHLLIEEVKKDEFTFADKLEHSRIINLLLAIAALIYMVKYFSTGGSLTLNTINISFLMLALLLNKTPRQFINNCHEGGKSLGPIVMQFPLYGGIMGMMVSSGLASVIAGWFVAISNEHTLPLFSFLSAGLINFFVPSGGSQWAVQGPIMMEAARAMDISTARVAMAVAWGDQWTNMIQPFWALPLLAIANMRAKDIMGYCIMALILGGVIMSLGILFLP